MVGTVGVYRRPAGLDPAGKPKGQTPEFYKTNSRGSQIKDENGNPIPDEVRNREAKEYVGAPYFDHTAIPVSTNPDGTVNLVIHGDATRDGFETRAIRGVKVSATLTPGAYTPASNTATSEEV